MFSTNNDIPQYIELTNSMIYLLSVGSGLGPMAGETVWVTRLPVVLWPIVGV